MSRGAGRSGSGSGAGAGRGVIRRREGAAGADGLPKAMQSPGGRQVRLLPDVDRPGGFLLTVDNTPQSFVDLRDPAFLEFEYVRRVGHVIDLAFPEGAALDAVHLGGGALTLPRYVAHTRPGSQQLAVELDAALIEFVRAHLPWDKHWRLRVRAADAREALGTLREGAWDLVVSDVFSGARTPRQVTSVEYVRLASRALRPGGVYVANIADGAPFGFARAQAATVAAVFAQVAVVAEPAVLRGRRFGNLVLVASHAPLPLAALGRRSAADPFPARLFSGEELTAWCAGAAAVTDEASTESPAPPPGAFEV
ncbi:MAG TPA: fused MFS/spermidine synthase [Actinocrinis sp.]|nr:fused MFS/spermidine synthase [Actinocrinis sp.]